MEELAFSAPIHGINKGLKWGGRESINLARGLRQGDPLSPVLFLLVMDVLHKLINHAAQQGVLQPIGTPAISHQCSLYADDTILFIAPTTQDLVATNAILELFGCASGLCTNMQKCIAAPICCSEEDLDIVQALMLRQILDFPITCLGISLSPSGLRKAHIELMVDKIKGRLPTWKAGLLHKSGRLSLMKSTLSAMPIYTLISIHLPTWALKVIDKYRRGFF